MTSGAFRKPVRQTAAQIFTIPAILAVLGGAGLVFALVGDGFWDGLSWITLSVPIPIFIISLLRGRL
ncbi:hypothetical protein X566_13590 [Afipia sp. P52-10]|jgi:hypothetical protein|uniref:hypothetical protein n=1 Tax=Afipia sp. P52-10 TaxID=1429916 RepID=UPI0003DEF5DC|nr:hypothetical protein [Afipia sp. P52-10]ETR78578.1 hypothetical protein X566_13590 [Afipia sp. P52-10]